MKSDLDSPIANRRFITGNSFPISLIQRKATIEPETFENYLYMLEHGSWESFWGHLNTLQAVNQACQHDLTPRVPRPALQLDADGYPSLYGESFSECWVFSPKYADGFRPAIGEEVSLDNIRGWQVLRIKW